MQRRFDWVIALGVLALGCSGPVSSAAAVGVTINIAQTGPCGIGASQPPDDIGNPPPDSSHGSAGKKVYDGEEGVKAHCSVKGDGPWKLSANISSKPKQVSFLLNNGNIGTDGSGQGEIEVATPALGNSVSSSPPGQKCSLDAVESGGGILVKSGAVWATFSCPSLHYPPSTYCFVTGEFVLENCDQ